MTTVPLLVSTHEELEAILAPRREAGAPVVLVPTMGALHAGHEALLRDARARAGAGVVVASVFVNPLQFAPGEDLDRYPRTLDADLELCASAGVDVVFAPAVDEMYPDGEPLVTVEPGAAARILEGESRPGHFRGVLTVVAKLFGLVRPTAAVFGEKDYQQLVLVRRMSRDLCLRVEVVGVGTVREPDGLALSSRNRFLDPDQRRVAATLSRALRAAQDHAAYGPEAARGRRVVGARGRAGSRGGLPRGPRPRPRRGSRGRGGAGPGRGPGRQHPAHRQPARGARVGVLSGQVAGASLAQSLACRSSTASAPSMTCRVGQLLVSRPDSRSKSTRSSAYRSTRLATAATVGRSLVIPGEVAIRWSRVG